MTSIVCVALPHCQYLEGVWWRLLLHTIMLPIRQSRSGVHMLYFRETTYFFPCIFSSNHFTSSTLQHLSFKNMCNNFIYENLRFDSFSIYSVLQTFDINLNFFLQFVNFLFNLQQVLLSKPSI